MLMRTDPEPDNGIVFFEQSDDTIRTPDANGDDRLCAMNTFEVEAWMSRIRREEPISCSRLLADVFGKRSKELPE